MIEKSRSSIFLGIVAFGLAVVTFVLLHNDPRQLLLMRNTLLLAAGACAIGVPLGTLLACLLLRTDVGGRRAALLVLVTMLFVPLYLQAASWDAGFGQLGWHSLARNAMTEPLLDGWRAAIWVHAMAAVPWVALITGVAICCGDAELEEQSLLAASTWQVLTFVTIPRALGGIVVAAFWVLLTVVVEMTVTDLYRVRTYAEEFYTGLALADPQQPMALAALPGITAGAALVSAASAVVLAATPALRVPARMARPMPLGGSRWWITLVVGMLLLLIAGVPLGNLIYKAGMGLSHVEGQRVLSWSPWQFARIAGLSPWKFRVEIGWTIVIGGIASTAALAVGAPLAWWTRRGGWRALPAVSLVALGTVVPGPLIGLSVIWLLDRQSPAICMWLYDRSVFAPVLAILVRVLPVTVLMCWYTFRSISDDVLDSAACEGAGYWTQFGLIAVPIRWAGLATAWLAGFAIATGDLACSILVVPPGVTTVSVRVFGLIHAGVDDQVAGLCLTVVVGVAALAAASTVMLRTAGKGGQAA